MKRLAIIVAIVALLAPAAVPQGSVTASWSQTAFANATGTGPSAVFRNIGQGCHWLHFSTGAGFGITIQLEGSSDATNWFQISESATIPANGSGVIEAGGYYPNVRANITAITGAGTANAEYFASGGICTSGGVLSGVKTSQPVTFVATTAFTNTNLLSGVVIVSSSGGTVYGGFIENTSAADVYLVILDLGQLPAGANIVQRVCATNSTNCPKARDINLPAAGVKFTSRISALCTTSLIGAGADPATGCVLNLYYKPNSTYTGKHNNLPSVPN